MAWIERTVPSSMVLSGKRRSTPGVASILGLVLAMVAAGCGFGDPGPTAGTFPLTAGVLHPFTGQNAFFGENAQNACRAAAQQINEAGGILGHPLNCTAFDTKGDATDAVAVTSRMLVSAPHLAMVVGPDGDDIFSVLPLLEQARMPEMNTVGDPRYDAQTSPYFWRLTPSDSTQAPALARYAYGHGYRRVAELFTTDLSAQTTTGPFRTTFTAMGGTIVENFTVLADETSYRTAVSEVIATHPQAIVGELDANTAATFLGELRRQHGGGLIPFVVTQRATQPDWAAAVQPAVGGGNLSRSIVAVAPAFTQSGPAFEAFQHAMGAVRADQFQKQNAFVAAYFDGVIAFALALFQARSLSPQVYVKTLPKITAASSGATVVRTYAEGVAALQAGKTIQYVGVTGPMAFNRYNTADRPYAAWTFSPARTSWVLGATLPAGP